MQTDLIMDVGMHTGEDTARFLSAGFRVVAVEANPEIVARNTETFHEEIAEGRLHIVNAAIAEQRGTASFGISDDNTVWSSLAPEMISRNERLAQSSYRYITVDTIPFGDVLREFGMPYYLKVDIEGYDMLCVRGLREFQDRPAFVSIESRVSVNEAAARAVLDELAELWKLGYRAFRYVDQSRGECPVPVSGHWAGPSWTSAWKALPRAQALRAHQNLAGFGGRWTQATVGKVYQRARRLGNPSWFDLHAALTVSE